MRLLLVLLAIGFASPAFAAPAPASTVAACVAAAEGEFAAQRACIGQVNAACQEAEDGGGVTTAGMVTCANRERDQWVALRDAALSTLRTRENAAQSASRDRALSAHATWSQARCAYDASLYEGGSMAIYAVAACEMGQTADIALTLHMRAHDLLPD
jgi:hypothetical protein